MAHGRQAWLSRKELCSPRLNVILTCTVADTQSGRFPISFSPTSSHFRSYVISTWSENTYKVRSSTHFFFLAMPPGLRDLSSPIGD